MGGELNPGLMGESQICNPLDHGHLFDNSGLAFELVKTKKNLICKEFIKNAVLA